MQARVASMEDMKEARLAALAQGRLFPTGMLKVFIGFLQLGVGLSAVSQGGGRIGFLLQRALSSCGGGTDTSFDTNMVIILAALLFALLFALGLNSLARYLIQWAGA